MKALRPILSIVLLLCILKGALPLAALFGGEEAAGDGEVIVQIDEDALWGHLLASLSKKLEEKEGKKEEKKEGERSGIEHLSGSHFPPSNSNIQSALASCEAVKWHHAHAQYANIHSKQARLAYLFTHRLKVQC